MKLKAGIIGIMLICLGLNAFAYTSAYTAISVPGDSFLTWWDVNSNPLTNTADYTWSGIVNFPSNSGAFKFAANHAWTINWGGNFTVAHVPARGVGSLSLGGVNASYNNIATGMYAVTFHEQTATFDLVPVATAPNPTAVQLIGSFNGDGATSVGTMTNVSGYVWATTLELGSGADFLFKVVTASGSNNWGALAATNIALLPFSGGNPCGSARYTMNGVLGGTFVFTFNFQSNTFAIAQTQTNTFTLASVTATGNFVAGNPPDVNLEKISASVWRSDFTVTNATQFKLSFLGRDSGGGIGRYWGATNVTTNVLPATGYLLSSSSNSLTNVVIAAVPGNYRITFDSSSGEFSVLQRYTASSGINYLQNPSFESVDSGNPTGWGVYHATSGEQADFGAHSGARCGVLQPKLFEDWADIGNFDQTTSALTGLSGQVFRVSAAFRTLGAWEATTVRIIVEWKNGTNVVKENAMEVTGLTNQWKTYALEAIVPSNSITPHVLLKYDGVSGTGYLLVDDAEARIAASRFQNFDAWGNIGQFTNISPDWAVSSGKTILNAGDNAPTGGVVISKYIEGSDNNKAIEIFNGTGAATNLLTGQYVLQQYNNGALSAAVNIALSGVIPPGECLIVSRPGTPTNAYPPSAAILSASTNFVQTNAVTFNGDDAIVLRRGGTNGPIVDRVGQVGTNVAGSIWARNATDHSFRRKNSVFWGVTNAPTNEFALSEWNVYAKDSFAELGVHFFSLNDPNAPYNPTGYSLLLNTNAALTSPELDGGIGDVAFYARAQGALAGSPLQVILETAPSQTSTNWTLIDTLSIPLTATNFTLYSSYATQPTHAVLRIRHVGDGTTNRLRIDDVVVSEAYLVKRSENFGAWTNYLGAPIGTYSKAEWTVQNAQIGTNGLNSSVAADLHPETGSLTSPTFEDGAGTVTYWISQHPLELGEVRATILTSTNGGTSWEARATNSLPAAGTNVLRTNFTVSIFYPMSAAVRISAGGSPSPFVVDNVEIAIPTITRTLTFNDFALSADYKAYFKDGWNLSDLAIVTNLLYSGNAARMRNSTIASPYVDEIGPISFYYAQYGSESTAQLTVEISSNAANWIVLNSGISVSPTPAFYSYYNTNANYHYVRIRQTTTDKHVHIDQISLDAPAPIPTCTVTAGLSPAAPAPDEGFYLTADVVPRYGADILAVTGSYRIASGAWTALPMTAVAYGSYRSELLPPRPAGTKVTYKAAATYAGTGAYPGSTSYTTNVAYSSTNVIYISAVPRGTVWINELFYSSYVGEYDFWEGLFIEDHEYIELCGVAGTSITNWRVQLAFCSSSDILKNGGQAVYATYTIPSGTVISNTTNGFGFYVIGDAQLATNHPINQFLTTVVPTNVVPNAVAVHDHIHDRSGIIRLLDNYSNVVYSLSYGAYDSNSDRIPVSQQAVDNTNSLSLSGTGSTYDDFGWNNTNALTIGGANTGQTLVPDTGLPPMAAWHTPAAVAATSLQGTFSQFQPIHAAQSDTLYVHYAYTNSAFNYATIDGYVHYHKQGDGGAWSTAVKQADFPGNYDTNGIAYLRMSIPSYTFDRLDTIEYVIEAIPNNPSLATAWLGSDGDSSSAIYTSLAEAELYPFRYTFPIADPIAITKLTMSLTNTVLRLETDGNDTLDPIVNFNVRYSTNMLQPPSTWSTVAVQSITRTNEQNYFDATRPTNGTKNFFAVQPLWP